MTEVKPDLADMINIPDQGGLKRIEEAIDFKFGESWSPEVRDRLGEYQSISTQDKENRPFAMITLDKSKWKNASKASTFLDLNPIRTRDIRVKASQHFKEDEVDKWADYSIEFEEQQWKKKTQIIVKDGYLQTGISFDESSIQGENKKPLEAMMFIDKIVEIANYINKK